MKRAVLLEEAVEDLEAAKAFYDRIQEGVGDDCVGSLLSDVERLSLSHGIHPKFFGFYRVLGSRFPFGLYYVDDPHEVRVIAILDLRRNPAWIRRE